MIKEFKAFVMKGNVMDLAVAVVIGAAFSAIVKSLVDNLIMPIIGMIVGGINFAGLVLTVGKAKLEYGLFLQAVVNFLLISLVIFLMIRLFERFKKPAPVTTRECPYCLTEVPKAATRCSACTQEIEKVD